jgi:hypothetical protein
MAKARIGKILQLKVSLDEISPLVWRRVLVPNSATFQQLHEVIQAAFGWHDYHLHEFEVRGERVGFVLPDDEDPPEVNGKKKRLATAALKRGDRFPYVYDFGDEWRHTIVVEKVLEPDPRFSYPVCTGGARACPPEDSGGPYSYPDFVAALANREHEQHDELVRWVGGYFDPEGFDPNAVNERLRRPR